MRRLVEFLLRSGDIDRRFGYAFADTDVMQMGARLHRKIQKGMGSNYRAEVPLAGFFPCDDFVICVEGRADGILTDENGVMIDEIKGMLQSLEYLEEPVPVHLAQAKCYAFLYGLEQGWSGAESGASASSGDEERIRVRMSYASLETEEMKYFHFSYSFSELSEWFGNLLEEYKKWARFEHEWKLIRRESIRATSFPFSYREGQKDLAAGVYRTIAREKILFIQAPTGTGKTISTVFPAVKAIGEGKGDRIFYLTAKTIARTVAAEALSLLRGEGLRMKSIILTAKEKICPLEETLCDPEHCPYAKGHYDRINDALYRLITEKDTFDRPAVEEASEKYKVCPYELSLDLSSWMDIVICDYNYVFAPRTKLRRFFGEGVKGDYIFLIDEAHNLVERGREMFSAALIKEDFLEIRRTVKNTDPKLARSLKRCSDKMLAWKREIGTEDDSPIRPKRGENWRICRDPESFAVMLLNLSGLLEDYLDRERKAQLRTGGRKPAEKEKIMLPEERSESVMDFYFTILSFLETIDHLGEDYISYTEVEEQGNFAIRLFCVDPSKRLQECMDKARSTILFSATLLPIDYYRSLLCDRQDCYSVYAKTCFSPEKLQVLIGRDTSSRYQRRTKDEYQRIASYIRVTVSRRKGNYLIFFSSYRMLEDTAAALEDNLPPGYEMLCQKSGMNESEREKFLEAFSEDRPEGLIGMCVMGSIFGEGIDLKRDCLIGAIVVGTGLPMVCTRQEILRQYYDEKGEDGFRNAYLCPGMNKVMQAAGRVIRTEEDRGIAVLLDERFTQPSYRSMFPREWEGYRICTLSDVERHIDSFWRICRDPGDIRG